MSLESSQAPRLRKEVRAFLFADIKGFSKIPDSQLPDFVLRFFDGAAEVLHRTSGGARIANTWGDALFAVFDEVGDAAETALILRDWSRSWFDDADARMESSSMAGQPSLRISLHAGPVLVGTDAVIGAECHIGQHVVRAARLEPSADAGNILVTEELAALAAASPVADRFRFDYQGLVKLAKEYGRLPAYRLERAGAAKPRADRSGRSR